MDCYAKFLIQFIYGMQKELKEVEVAVFSTHLTDITGLLRRKGLAEGLNEVADVVPDWSGGTKIGESLLEFYRQFAPSFSAYRSVVILISDGWDRGDVEGAALFNGDAASARLSVDLAQSAARQRRLPTDLSGYPHSVAVCRLFSPSTQFGKPCRTHKNIDSPLGEIK